MVDFVVEKIELNLPGLNELMKSEPIQGALEKATKAVAKEAERISGNSYSGRKARKLNWLAMANAGATGSDPEGEEMDNNYLLKAVGACGLSTRKGSAR